MNIKFFTLPLFVALILTSSACARRKPAPLVSQQAVVTTTNETLPEGAVKYCWEEPRVEVESVRPGVNAEGSFYRPAHDAVREVKMGKWVPCNGSKSGVE
jgi:hypothetical protein